MGLAVRPGARFRSSVCSTEVAVIKAPSDAIDLRIGGHSVLPIEEARPEGLTPKAGYPSRDPRSD